MNKESEEQKTKKKKKRETVYTQSISTLALDVLDAVKLLFFKQFFFFLYFELRFSDFSFKFIFPSVV